VKPFTGWSIMAGVAGAIDAFTRGLAVDLAPIRVNIVSPGAVKTEVRTLFFLLRTDIRRIIPLHQKIWDTHMSPEVKEQRIQYCLEKLLVEQIAEADEIAEAYLFCMKSVPHFSYSYMFCLTIGRQM